MTIAITTGRWVYTGNAVTTVFPYTTKVFVSTDLRVELNDAEAVKWYQLSAGQGYVPALTSLGWMFQEGRGVQRDDVQAVHWYRHSAKQGYPSALNNLGYHLGRIGRRVLPA